MLSVWAETTRESREAGFRGPSATACPNGKGRHASEHGLRSERQLMERLEFDLLFRWFVGLCIDHVAWDQTSFGKNRDRLLAGDVAARFLAEVLADAKVKRLLSSEHFSVDGTLVEAWASMKSFRPKDGSGEPPAPGRNSERDFHGERRCNDTHARKDQFSQAAPQSEAMSRASPLMTRRAPGARACMPGEGRSRPPVSVHRDELEPLIAKRL
jgi:hypothetical protein